MQSKAGNRLMRCPRLPASRPTGFTRMSVFSGFPRGKRQGNPSSASFGSTGAEGCGTKE